MKALNVLVCTVLTTACGSATDPPRTDDETGPEVIDLGDHREVRLTFESSGVELAGTLYLPPGGEPFTTIVEHQGSSWTLRSSWSEIEPFVLGLDVAFFSFDRRGFGGSTGTGEGMVHADFADDLGAAVLAVADLDEWVDPSRLGLLGGSFGGWILPLTANALPGTVRFLLTGSGGVVSDGQEALFDELTGFAVCQETDTPLSEITQVLRDAGPSGFDPRPSLVALVQPALWLFGGNDRSHPTELSVEILEDINDDGSRDWTALVFPDANHSLVAGGAICQEEGEFVDFVTPLTEWLVDRQFLSR